MATESDITVVQGETKRFTATWVKDGVEQSLEGYSAFMQVRRRPGSFGTAPILDLSSVYRGSTPALTIEPGGAKGRVGVRIPSAATYLVTRNAWFDLFVVKDADPTSTKRLLFGRVILSRSATDLRSYDITADTGEENPDIPVESP